MNKKMILIGTVGGREDDLSCAYEVGINEKQVKCTKHYYNEKYVEGITPDYKANKVFYDRVIITLEKMAFNGVCVGSVGKCPLCGKIYYSIGG